MKIHMVRCFDDNDSTIGFMEVGDNVYFTCEDEFREDKVAGETRIPDGEYEIKLRDAGGMNVAYKERYQDDHHGMLWLQDVPGFEWIYIHTGNNDDHSEGCILVGMSASNNMTISRSREAYYALYKEVSKAILDGEKVTIDINTICS